jgi:DNA-binding transcriptional LysR family regulator
MNPARFDLVSVRLVVSAAQSGSLTAAAAEAHLALAAASRRLRELESALGTPLFERHPRGLHITAAGRVFVKHGLTLLQAFDQIGVELADLRQGLTRHVRLAASTAAISQFLPPLLARYALECPQVRVDLEEQVSDQVVATLREGRADVGLFVEGPDASGLQTQLFREDELVLVLPATHLLAKARGALTFAGLLDEDWIGLNTGAAVLQAQQQAAVAAGRPLRLRMQVRSFDAACHMVASGLGLAVLPKAATLPMVRAMKLATRPLADAWARRRMLVATKAGLVDPGAADLVAFLVAAHDAPSQTAKAKRLERQ